MKRKKRLLAVLAISTGLSFAAFAPVSTHPCRQIHEQVTQPLREVSIFLASKPGADTLAGPGCVFLLSELRRMPVGARLIRKLGAHGLPKAFHRCATRIASVHYPCVDSKFGPTRCLPEAYAYCGEWEYSLANEPKYELGFELSTRVDVAYEKTQQLCGMAMRREDAGALEAAARLEAYIRERIEPRADRFYGLACDSQE